MHRLENFIGIGDNTNCLSLANAGEASKFLKHLTDQNQHHSHGHISNITSQISLNHEKTLDNHGIHHHKSKSDDIENRLNKNLLKEKLIHKSNISN